MMKGGSGWHHIPDVSVVVVIILSIISCSSRLWQRQHLRVFAIVIVALLVRQGRIYICSSHLPSTDPLANELVMCFFADIYLQADWRMIYSMMPKHIQRTQQLEFEVPQHWVSKSINLERLPVQPPSFHSKVENLCLEWWIWKPKCFTKLIDKLAIWVTQQFGPCFRSQKVMPASSKHQAESFTGRWGWRTRWVLLLIRALLC